VDFRALVEMMVEADLAALQEDGYKAKHFMVA
jgi:hypothetical protein